MDNPDTDDTPLPDLPHIPNPKRFEPSDKTMNNWLRRFRDMYLIQLLRRDGCAGTSTELCPGCSDDWKTPMYRCRECAGGVLLCSECCLNKHIDNPLHVIKQWSGVYFYKRPLKDLGQRIQFGHPPRERYGNPQAAHSDFVVLHNNGIHEVHVDFCGCDTGARAQPYIQLLRAGWYPASDDRPRTAATFHVLDNFHLHTLQAKTTAYDFYAVLERLTDNTGVKPPNRYQVFLRMARQYRHLLMLKRAGRGHDPSGVWGTGAGELAVDCPVCPNPKVNLPEGWENAPPEDQFLYILFLALDACFRLKRRMVSSEIKDPGLGTGWAYVVENAPYQHYLKTVTDQKEMSTCSGLAALNYANTKFLRGYSTTGVGMGVCARHEFVQPNSVGDLQKGERFVNMDYIFASILRHKDPRIRKIVSYDIVCQWWKYVLERLQKLPPLVRISIILKLFRFVIPKMHIHSHTLDCQVQFSLNLVPGSGQTDGEGIERPWASIGAITTSTRVSGPGAHHDSLDDHWNFWNWLKTIGLPALLRRRLDAARKEQASQREAFELFSIHTAYTPSAFINAGLALEEQQRRVRVQAELKKAGTTAMEINLKTLRSKLNRGLDRFRQVQATYSPASLQVLSARVAPADELAEHVPLMLPSALAPAQREGGGCVIGLVDIENDLRAAQCRTALPRLRNQLHIKSRFLLYKKHNARHQGMNTRSRTIVARNETKICLHSEKLQMVWEARLRIVGGDASKVGWPRLKKEDIRCMQDAEEMSRNTEKRRRANEQRTRREEEYREDGLLPALDDDDDVMVTRGGENMREISWIWTLAGTAGTDEELEDALRIEWAKAWARSRRWTEEVRLLEEEWRRLPVRYAHREWLDRAVAVRVGEVPFEEAQGMIAYAAKHAQLYRKLAARAEETRTEMKLQSGKKRRVFQPSWDPIIGTEADDGGAGSGGDDDDDEDDERGDIESDEELLMGGEVDDD
ncbi:hypothetical protein C8F04DRAFT_1279172 [Mycena alexandri]|uniref:CxC2-like cysteine cluster KDZ transposase-associated domain-containing protein n=1 Tax=Mycena alexandri TaxID=1745969 RepID=A0AAD6WKT5_9AGAR|nr:hypothetical protein C8F04DRAFT_1279172 [Mycena alexandri]